MDSCIHFPGGARLPHGGEKTRPSLWRPRFGVIFVNYDSYRVLTVGVHAQRGYPGSCPVCVCQCVHGSNLLVAQLYDKLVILTGSVSCSLQTLFGVFRILASFRR